METQVDILTELPNRPAFDQALKQRLRSESAVALAVLDIDHFLEINEEHGSEIGDRILRHVAALLQQEAPGAAYRIAGDEFALLLPENSLEQAFLRMEGLRKRVQESAGAFDLPKQREVTIGIGVAQYPRDARDPESLLNAADAALSAVKENGRNQVGLPLTEEMVMKSCYYAASSVRKLKALAERLNRKESLLLREALTDLLRKYDLPRGS